MRKWGKFAVAVFLFAGLVPAMQVQITTLYFTGVCRDCAGTASGQLVLSGYRPGQSIQPNQFVSLSYSSNLTNFTVTRGNLNAISGQFPVGLPAAANITISSNGNQLFTQTNGYWCAGLNCALDNGPSHSWSLTAPPPAGPAAPTNTEGAPALSDTLIFSTAVGIAVLGAILLKRHQARHSA